MYDEHGPASKHARENGEGPKARGGLVRAKDFAHVQIQCTVTVDKLFSAYFKKERHTTLVVKTRTQDIVYC